MHMQHLAQRNLEPSKVANLLRKIINIVDMISKNAEQRKQASARAGTFPSALQGRSSAKPTHFSLLNVWGGRTVQEYAVQEQVSA